MKGLNDPSKTFDACKSTIKPRQTGYNGVEEEEGRGGEGTWPTKLVLDKYSSMGTNTPRENQERWKLSTRQS